MRWLLNTVYLLLLTALSPFIVWRVLRHGRYRKGISRRKCSGDFQHLNDGREVVWFHAVSVGEVIQLQKVVEEFRRQTSDRFSIVVSTSTDTGFELAIKRFPDCHVTWFPLDFSWAVASAVRAVQARPGGADGTGTVAEFSGGMSETADSRRGDQCAYERTKSSRLFANSQVLMAPLFGKLALVAAQSQANADRLQSLGVCPRSSARFRVHQVRWNRHRPQQSSDSIVMREVYSGLTSSETIFMAGSTQELLKSNWPFRPGSPVANNSLRCG
jgi:3-deoxy-D-manno-octulosonic-acid transferase